MKIEDILSEEGLKKLIRSLTEKETFNELEAFFPGQNLKYKSDQQLMNFDVRVEIYSNLKDKNLYTKGKSPFKLNGDLAIGSGQIYLFLEENGSDIYTEIADNKGHRFKLEKLKIIDDSEVKDIKINIIKEQIKKLENKLKIEMESL